LKYYENSHRLRVVNSAFASPMSNIM